MGRILEQLGLWIESIILAIGYPGITLVMLAENLFPPIPSELVMPFAGFLVGRGELNLLLAIGAGTLGSVLGAVVLYYVGMLAGEPLVRPFFRNYGRFFLLSEQDLDKALHAFTTHGDIIVLGGRVIPIIRSLISLPAGMNRMPLGRFLLFTTIGSTIWTSLLTIGGVILGANWEFVIEIVDQYQKLVLAVLAITAVVFVVQRLRGLRGMALSRRSESVD
ncbi:DedA family protein [Chloroflexus sp.]|uniref:DedA family protein n=1 Tax=Chloroflexus sp. TaxID=1904827 RepID=UPI00261C1299|nr:DedA family protein [uncultured Chloroflexus sp.]